MSTPLQAADEGLLLTLSEFALAAYASGDWQSLVQGWDRLDGADLDPALFDGSNGQLLADGIFTHENAAALVARQGDTLVVAFRGTDGSTWSLDHWKDLGHWADPAQFASIASIFFPTIPASAIAAAQATLELLTGYEFGRPAHYALFEDLIAELDDYVAANGITKVFAVGHSLGSAMVNAWMAEHANGSVSYEALTFANPGFSFFQDDGRITNFWTDSDPIRIADIFLATPGDDNVFDDDLLHPLQSHSMRLYLEAVEFIIGEGVPAYLIVHDGDPSTFNFDEFIFHVARNTAVPIDHPDAFFLGTGSNKLAGNSFDGDNDEVLLGGAGSDEARGGPGTDLIVGGTGNDFGYGGIGDDTYIYRPGDGQDYVDDISGASDVGWYLGGFEDDGGYYFRSGNDLVFRWVGGGQVTVHDHFNGHPIEYFRDNMGDYMFRFEGTGTVANEMFAGGSGANTFLPGGGRDLVSAGGGRDTIIAGSGAGDDYYDGGPDVDTITFSSATAEVTVDLVTGHATGTEIGSDRLIRMENVLGGAGGDTIIGGAGNNMLDGGPGADTLVGGDGDDILVVDNAGDTVTEAGGAKSGIDQIKSYISFDLGSDGANVEKLELLGTDPLNGFGNALGNVLRGNDASNFLDGGDGKDTLIGGGGADILIGGAGNDIIDGGANTMGNGDQAIYANAAVGVTVNLSTGTATDGRGGTDTLIGIEVVIGSAFSDKLVGSAAGNELFEGGGGNDVINGGGNGTVKYGDFAQYTNSATSGVSVDLGLGTATDGLGGTDTLVNIESINATPFDDTVIGNAAPNLLRGFNGGDTLRGGGGGDFIEGDQLSNPSSLGNDYLYGDGGADTIYGNRGNDLIDGGIGHDLLFGGSGDDTFVFRDGSGFDEVFDFVAGAGAEDRINLAGVSGVGTFSAVLAVASDNGAFTTIDFGGGDVLRLHGVLVSQLTSNDFVLV